MLCNGLKIISPNQQEFPVIQAQLNTRLFNLLYNSEKLVCQELQRLVFKASGQLPKEAVVPVALAMWLLARLHSLKAIYLVNHLERNGSRTFQLPYHLSSWIKIPTRFRISWNTSIICSSPETRPQPSNQRIRRSVSIIIPTPHELWRQMQQRFTGGKRGFDTAIKGIKKRSHSIQEKRLSQSLEMEQGVLEGANW